MGRIGRGPTGSGWVGCACVAWGWVGSGTLSRGASEWLRSCGAWKRAERGERVRPRNNSMKRTSQKNKERGCIVSNVPLSHTGIPPPQHTPRPIPHILPDATTTHPQLNQTHTPSPSHPMTSRLTGPSPGVRRQSKRLSPITGRSAHRNFHRPLQFDRHAYRHACLRACMRA